MDGSWRHGIGYAGTDERYVTNHHPLPRHIVGPLPTKGQASCISRFPINPKRITLYAPPLPTFHDLAGTVGHSPEPRPHGASTGKDCNSARSHGYRLRIARCRKKKGSHASPGISNCLNTGSTEEPHGTPITLSWQ